MRKTKCKSCNGSGDSDIQNLDCRTCGGTREISVYTIQELREGKVAICDHSKGELVRIFNYLGIDTNVLFGYLPIYYIINGCYAGTRDTDLPTQSVKIFLEEIEQEEKQRQIHVQSITPMSEILEPEFKWGEEVEVNDGVSSFWRDGFKYGCLHVNGKTHVVFHGDILTHWSKVRKPQQITLTLSQIAEKFNCKPNEINIPDYEIKKN